MAEIITAIYETEAQVTNAVDDLISTGIPREKFRVHDQRHQVQVLTPGVAEPEILEILRRHQPLELSPPSL